MSSWSAMTEYVNGYGMPGRERLVEIDEDERPFWWRRDELSGQPRCRLT
jgi:hypothetical protein